MGQPNPPGDIPLIEGLGSEWNELVGYIPEDKRTEFGPKFKERISQYEALKPWEEFQKSGITPEHAGTALDVFAYLENNPKEIYETLGKHLGITKEEAKEVVKEVQASDGSNPEIAALKQQLDTMSQILLAQRQMTTQEKQAADADAAVNRELEAVKKKYGNDIPEDEIIMRMVHKDMSAEDAYKEYSGMVSDIQKRRPSPLVMGAGGSIPNQKIDVTKLDSKGTKSLVAQMFEQANAERNQ